jgi:L-amino acid N-acyltransferase
VARRPRPFAAPCDDRGEVLGWASLSRFSPRSAYRFTVENSIYIRHDVLGKGIGRALLNDLLERAAGLALQQVIAIICTEHPRSIDLHRRAGFVQVGHLKNVGFKFDRWLDVVYLQRALTAG